MNESVRCVALLAAAAAMVVGCSSSGVDRSARASTSGSGGAGATAALDAAAGGSDPVSDAGTGATPGSGGGSALDASGAGSDATPGSGGGGTFTDGGLVCTVLAPTTDSGTCPVMPPGGVLCAPPPVAPVDCGNRGTCAYPSGPGIPERTCSVVCADAQGACPPAESVCTPVVTCQSAADCHGDLPKGDCVACPLAADGTETTACAHWACAAGRCTVGYCEAPSEPTCNGGHGCPSYTFPASDRGCAADSDCDMYEHFESCCATRFLGVSVRDKSRAWATETQCRSVIDPYELMCGCPPITAAEDWYMPGPGQSIVPACVAGTCRAVLRP